MTHARLVKVEEPTCSLRLYDCQDHVGTFRRAMHISGLTWQGEMTLLFFCNSKAVSSGASGRLVGRASSSSSPHSSYSLSAGEPVTRVMVPADASVSVTSSDQYPYLLEARAQLIIFEIDETHSFRVAVVPCVSQTDTDKPAVARIVRLHALRLHEAATQQCSQ